ncbi:coronin SCDLUD_004316 [Saccharomycodes ludwigii]|uniref:coronin n=1 Tax=Saccharomycodes ludwigii TaxID=36035 RepID=UPI001E8801CD|nr:hypothetical protein SCDLUD_004316 [Saccharomycodes ludwigii]KAH3899999.1 hypothetical protein SCDLUD_004316 [Saccharomycodes ludwigii]
MDYTVRIWNIETGKDEIILKHPDMVTSMSFSYNGKYLATVAKDKKLRVWDVRNNKIVSEGKAHDSPKNQRVVWLGADDRLATTGFSRLSDRQIGIWDAFNLEKGDLGGFYTVDQSAGILMPFYDDSNKILYLAGKGDGNIRYFEFNNDELFELSEYSSTQPQRGFCMAPKRTVNVHENEIMKAYKTVNDLCIEPISFICPRRSEVFQDDIYPNAASDQPALTAEEWFSGKDVDGPILFDFKSVYDNTKPTLVAYSTKNIKKEKEQEPEEPHKQVETPKAAEVKKVIEEKPTPVVMPAINNKSNIDDVLKKDNGVPKLLQKAVSLDAVNGAENPESDESKDVKDEEWEEVKKPVETSNKSNVSGRSSSASKTKQDDNQPGTIAATKVIEAPKKSNASTTVSSSNIVSTPKATNETPTTATTSSTSKSMGLKQSVDKLSSLVLHLESIIEGLTKSNLEKDDRLKALEDKVNELLDKK